MAYQLSAKDVIAAASIPFMGAAAAGAGRSRMGMAASVLSQLQDAGIVSGPVSPSLNDNPEGTLSVTDYLNMKGKLKAREYPRKAHITRVMAANGQHNSGLMQEVAEEAGRMQSLREHNDTLLKYLKPGMTPRQAQEAIAKGYKEEKKLPAYWDDQLNRRFFNVRSDAVHGIKVTPDGYVQVKWRGSPTWYTFQKYPDTHQASLAVQELLKEPSLGRAVWPVLTRKGGDKLAAKGYGKWNIAHYNGAFATE